jgi:hypothetical protein
MLAFSNYPFAPRAGSLDWVGDAPASKFVVKEEYMFEIQVESLCWKPF